MKKWITASLLMMGMALATTSFAQLSVGAGLAYGTGVEELGIQVRGIYGFNDTWRGGADFIYYLDGAEGVSFWEFNVNGHYIFADSGQLKTYAFAGLNFTHVTVDLGQFGSAGNTDTGVNLGAGAQLKLSDKISGLGEVKYVLGGGDQLVLSAGVLVNLN
ncbi:MAG: outer membrane beta-barrel protein [Lewinellaceae bacterium]|nr:outer membrane beta-barrel protein [Lewinellaceae bacterium]